MISLRKTLETSPSSSLLLIRLMVGLIFLTEGLQKFIFPELYGPARFAGIGFPVPEFLSYLTAVFEIVCGSATLLGFLTRLAAVPLAFIMVIALFSTKFPVLLNQGLWVMLRAARLDYALLLGCVYLLLEGAGKNSIDAGLVKS